MSCPFAEWLKDFDEPDEGPTFPQYEKLPLEMRNHTLKLADKSTRLEYSTCSKLCSAEVQRFNTKPPICVRITESNDGIIVKLNYNKIEDALEQNLKNVDRTFLFSEYPNIIDDIVSYLDQCYKYVRNEKTMALHIYMKKWSNQLMRSFVGRVDFWMMVLTDTMIDDFLTFAGSPNFYMDKLDLHMCHRHDEKLVTLNREQTAKLFNSELFGHLTHFGAEVVCDISDQVFLGIQHGVYMEITCSMSVDMIRKKVDQLNQMEDWKDFMLVLPIGDNGTLDTALIFPEELYPEQHEKDGWLIVGKVMARNEENKRVLCFATFSS